MKAPQFKNTLDEVEYLLEKYPEAKNNDFYLQWVWLKEIMKFDLPDIPSRRYRDLAGRMCSIRRARQRIQGNGKFLPTDKNILDRRRKWHNTSPKESLLVKTTPTTKPN